VTPPGLRARAAAYFIEPREHTHPPGDLGDLVPLVRREPPPRRAPAFTPPMSKPTSLSPDAPPATPFADPAMSRPASPQVGERFLVGPVVSPLVGERFGDPVASNPALPVMGERFGDSIVSRPASLPVGERFGDGPVGRPAVAPPGAPLGSAPRAAVLGRASGAVPAAAALACSLRVAHGANTGVVATWTPGSQRGPSPRGPGAPSALRLAARLAARGLAATAHGRLVWLRLDDHVVAASLAARRASAVLDVPLVVALCGPRCDVVEALLGEQDFVVVVAGEPDTPLARLAVAGCERPATAWRAPHGPRRALALCGLGGRSAAQLPWRPR
jgi:hypothetical protein